MTLRPSFPPLLSGLNTAGADPVVAAVSEARAGCDAGLILFDAQPERLRAAVVFAPDVTLADAMAMQPLCAVAFQNALGALGPSELPVHLEWAGPIRVNGGLCGRLRSVASSDRTDEVPDWLVVGLEVDFIPVSDDTGATPDRTALYAEGCGGLDPLDLLESWARHMLTWIHRWEDEGMQPLHREWSGLAHGMGQEIDYKGQQGTFLGLDERLGLLFRTGGTTRLVPLTDLLETTP